MKLHWSPRSPFVRKVMILLHEIDMVESVELIRSRVAMTDPNLEVMKDNPLSKIPTLVLGNGDVLYDSRVICEYLDSLHGKDRLFPQDPSYRWKSLRFQALGDGTLDALVLWRNELMRTVPFEKLAAVFELKISTVLDRLEADVEELASLPFSIGHISVGCALSYLDFRFDNLAWRDEHPQLAQWFDGFLQRSSVVETSPIDE